MPSVVSLSLWQRPPPPVSPVSRHQYLHTDPWRHRCVSSPPWRRARVQPVTARRDSATGTGLVSASPSRRPGAANDDRTRMKWLKSNEKINIWKSSIFGIFRRKNFRTHQLWNQFLAHYVRIGIKILQDVLYNSVNSGLSAIRHHWDQTDIRWRII